MRRRPARRRTIPGCLFIAWINNTLYGSPLASGYGSLSFAVFHRAIVVNLERYGRWLIESQTPIAVLGVMALLVPSRLIWPTPRQQQTAWLLGATRDRRLGALPDLHAVRGLVVSQIHAAVMAGDVPRDGCGRASAWTASDTCTPRGRLRRSRFGVGAHGIRYAARNGAFPSGEGDHRYVSIAKMVEQATDTSAVIFTGQHSGPIRYYAGRTIIRYELLDPAWLDRAVQWLRTQGRRPYFLLEEWEMLEFENRFSATNSLGRLTLAPIVEYRARGVPGVIYLFDPRTAGRRRAHHVASTSEARRTCVLPSPLLHLR